MNIVMKKETESIQLTVSKSKIRIAQLIHPNKPQEIVRRK